MKNIAEIKQPQQAKEIYRPSKKMKPSSRRFSPFLWLSTFLFLFFIYKAFTKTGTPRQLILTPFIIANMAYADFALWRYFKNKAKYIIWVVEIITSATIIYWII